MAELFKTIAHLKVRTSAYRKQQLVILITTEKTVCGAPEVVPMEKAVTYSPESGFC